MICACDVYDFSGQRKREHGEIYGYHDASFGDCPDAKLSTGGHCVYWYGCPVAWVSKLEAPPLHHHQHQPQ